MRKENKREEKERKGKQGNNVTKQSPCDEDDNDDDYCLSEKIIYKL